MIVDINICVDCKQIDNIGNAYNPILDGRRSILKKKADIS
jgi:hypothetical protein